MTGLGSKLLDAAKRDYQGQLAKLFANLEILCNHPVGIGEHTDVVSEVQKCIESIHEYEGYIHIIENIEKQINQAKASLN